MAQTAPVAPPLRRIAVAGNPNAGKSSLFNCLTGLRQKVANYPGVTVERKTGRFRLGDQEVELIDLPGTYSLAVQSIDERIARDVLLGWVEGEPVPDAVVVVADATNLERNLFLVTQIVELGLPVVLALNMADVAEARGIDIDADALSERLGIPVVKTDARHGRGIDALRQALLAARPGRSALPLTMPVRSEVERFAERLRGEFGVAGSQAFGLALRLLVSPTGIDDARERFGPDGAEAVAGHRRELAGRGTPWHGIEAATRYGWLRQLAAEVVRRDEGASGGWSDRIDTVLTHKVWGTLIFIAIMAIVFQGVYTWAAPFMDAIDAGTAAVADAARANVPPGPLGELLVDGIIVGVGSVVIFLPQILFLFLFLAILEDTGYMARAAFVMDRVMNRVGLHGRSFVPLLSSFACAIPGIMAARTIGDWRDRLATILVAPLITCSARLPVYALLIAAFVPNTRLFGFLGAQGAALLGLYLLGVVAALGVAAVLKRTLLRGPASPMVLELPPYRVPSLKNVVRELSERAWLFLRFAGSIILSLSVVLWFLASYPKVEVEDATLQAQQQLAAAGEEPTPEAIEATAANIEASEQLARSFLGRIGHTIEPLVRPLGYDWRLGVGITSAFAAREVMVSTLGILFAVGDEVDEESESLIDRLRGAAWPDGSPLFTPATVASLLVLFALACQCISTVGVVVRETGGWKWAWIMLGYMTALAYVASLITYQGMRAAGWG